MEAVLDLEIAVLHVPVDKARAVFRGLVLVGHRRSAQVGHMFWALPGRGFADAVTLTQHDKHFRVIARPTDAELITLQSLTKELACSPN
jgi:hypothetical protein